jgi:hypothetical protein
MGIIAAAILPKNLTTFFTVLPIPPRVAIGHTGTDNAFEIESVRANQLKRISGIESNGSSRPGPARQGILPGCADGDRNAELSIAR